MTKMNWRAIRASIDSEEWQYSEENGQWERTIFLGTVFSLYPSGKYYTPWANSNVEPCPVCHGEGNIPQGTSRQRKKWQKQLDRFNRLADLRGRGPDSWAAKHVHIWRFRYSKLHHSCQHCGGMGSREALLDQQFQEELEAEANERDLFITSGEGDPCDVLVGETSEGGTCNHCGAAIPPGDAEFCSEECAVAHESV